MALDLAKNDGDRQAMLLALARLEYGRPFFLPPNVPADRVQALRRAFDAMKDPAYLAEADKLKIDVDPLTGEQVGALVEAGLAHAGRHRRPRARRDGASLTARRVRLQASAPPARRGVRHGHSATMTACRH